jgi:MFS transporter, DHA1 family, inner membrane transport protein
VTGSIAGNAVLLVGLWQFAPNSVAVVILLCLIWLVGFMFLAPVQSRVLREVSDAPNFASTLLSTSFQVGIAIGAALGGAVIAAGLGYAALPLVSAGFFGLGLLTTLSLLAYDRRLKAKPA